MENILLRFCRETNNYPIKTVAKKIGVNTQTYLKIEKGDIMLTNSQAKQLAKFYKADENFFYAAGLQLDMLLSMRKLVDNLDTRVQKSRSGKQLLQ